MILFSFKLSFVRFVKCLMPASVMILFRVRLRNVRLVKFCNCMSVIALLVRKDSSFRLVSLSMVVMVELEHNRRWVRVVRRPSWAFVMVSLEVRSR